jgi:hypothetical protein
MDNKTICPKCHGKGFIETFYRDVANASGVFYDQDVEYEIRIIRKKCTCQKVKET